MASTDTKRQRNPEKRGRFEEVYRRFREKRGPSPLEEGDLEGLRKEKEDGRPG